MKDKEIIQQIRSGNHNGPIKVLYKEFPKIKSMMLGAGGTAQEAEEIFNDSLILLIEKLSDPKFKLTSKLTTYLYGVNRFLWKNHLRKNQKSVELEWKDTLILTAEDLDYESEKEEKLKALESILERVTDRCKEIFKRFYFSKQNMKDIAKALGFSSVNSAKTQKYKCIERAVQILKSNPLMHKS